MWIGSIDKAVNEATSQKDIDFKLHIGGNMFTCVTTGILCIDMRQWYMKKQAVLRPGRTGIALKIPEWAKLRELIPGVVGCPGYVELGDDGQGVGEGECGVKEEVRDGRGGEGERGRVGVGERGRESDLVHSGHKLGRSRHPLPCGSGQLYN